MELFGLVQRSKLDAGKAAVDLAEDIADDRAEN